MKFILKTICSIVLLYGSIWGVLFVTHDKESQRINTTFPIPTLQEIDAWERKVTLPADAEFKVGMITDTHLDTKKVLDEEGIETERVIPELYDGMLTSFAQQMQVFDPQFIVHLGDVIEGTEVEEDLGKKETRLVGEALKQIGKPLYWAIGNHDLRSISRKHFRKELEIDYTDHYFDEGDYRFVILDMNYREDGIPNNPSSGEYIPGHLPETTVAWVEKVLDTSKRVYIFSHHSPAAEIHTDKKSIRNDREVRDLFAKYNVEAVFSGHIEKRYAGEENGVQYFTLPGIKKHALYPGAFYELTITGSTPNLTMHYQTQEGGAYTSVPFVEEGKMIGDILKEEKEQKEQAEQAKAQAQ